MPNQSVNQSRRSKLLILVVGLFIALGQELGWYWAQPQAAIKSQPGHYAVTQIYDGDTIGVWMNGRDEKVRFIGVDTPETHDPRKPVQCFGQAAAAFTSSLLGGKSVRLEADPTNSNRDRYDRLLRYVYLEDGRLVNLELISSGYGFAYLGFPFIKSEQFAEAERQARESSRGLWASCTPQLDTRGFIHSNPAVL